jgi:hypothetical protein
MAADHALLATFNKLGLNQWRIANRARAQLATFIQERIRHVYRRQRPTAREPHGAEQPPIAARSRAPILCSTRAREQENTHAPYAP